MNKKEIGIFGYGSLMNLHSAQKVLKRQLKLSELQPAILHDYVRIWNLKETLFFDSINAVATGVFLNIQPDLTSSLNGIVIQISEAELKNLKAREKNYNCIDITPLVDKRNNYLKIYTFVAKEEHILTEKDVNVFIPKKYMYMVENACIMIGSKFFNEYQKTTIDSPIPLIDGNYFFVDPMQDALT